MSRSPKTLYSDPPPKLTPKQANIYCWGWQKNARFRDAVCGRRFGKTFLGKAEIRRAVRLAATCGVSVEDEIWYAAPTFKQAKRVFWKRLKQAIPPSWRQGKPNETECSITTLAGHVVRLVGLDAYDNLRGSGLFFVLVDEWADCPYAAWDEVLRPMLSTCRYTTPGGEPRIGGHALRIGTPKGFNHCYETYLDGQGREPDHRSWLYTSIQGGNVPPEEVEAARRKMDTLSFQQEYEASFVNFSGRAYYPFVRTTHTAPLEYDPRRPLVMCFDFNVEPGIAAVCQEQPLPGHFERDRHGKATTRPLWGTGVIGEVWIPRNSNTPAVCRKLLTDWGKHEGPVLVYGDATGGSRGTAKTEGSDWDLIRRYLTHGMRDGEDVLEGFGDRVHFNVPAANPAERARVNAVNTRLQSADGVIHMLVDPHRAPHVVRDLEGVTLLEGGSGEIDKKANRELTHISDALGYYVEKEFPIYNNEMGVAALDGY